MSLACISKRYFVMRNRLRLVFCLQAFVGSRVRVGGIWSPVCLTRNSVSPLMKPFLTLKGWHEEKCVYWKVSVALKCVLTSSILFDAKRGPLKASVSIRRLRKQRVRTTFHMWIWLWHGICWQNQRNCRFLVCLKSILRKCRQWTVSRW